MVEETATNEPTLDTLTHRLDRLEREPKVFKRAVLGFLGLVLVTAGWASIRGDNPVEVARTWQEARVFLPPRVPPPSGTHPYLLPLKPANVPSQEHPLPTVLYLHGCTGFIPWYDGNWAETLTAAGYAVVMPTSLAREDRPTNCDPATQRAGWAPQVHEMRLEEIKYALEQLRTVTWVDQQNIFLMGHDEGGIAVARWSGSEFNGHIISGWKCTHPQGWLSGVHAPRTTPVLAINHQNDPWYLGALDGSCARRDNVREIILPGSGHETADSLHAREAVVQFLREHTGLLARANPMPGKVIWKAP